MRVSLLGCPFQTTYGRYIQSLRAGLEQEGAIVQWIGSNCGCQDAVETARAFQTDDLDYFEVPNEIGPWSIVFYSRGAARRGLKGPFRAANMSHRASRYERLATSTGAEVVHLQQTLNAFGSNVAFRLLNNRSRAAHVVTLHELDAEQMSLTHLNRTYNKAGAIIVHDRSLRDKVVDLGVRPDLVHVVCCGTDLTAFADEGEREGIVFYGGHFLNKGKGLETLLLACRRLKDRAATPKLRIHGHFGPPTADALEMVRRLDLVDAVEWLGDIDDGAIAALYRRSAVCVLPFTASFAGLPAGLAAANRLPIIATRCAGIPDHIGDLGLWIGAGDHDGLAARLEQVLGDPGLRARVGEELRAHAERHLGWRTIAQATLDVYAAARREAGAQAHHRALHEGGAGPLDHRLRG